MDESARSSELPSDLPPGGPTSEDAAFITMYEMYRKLRKSGFGMREAIVYLVEVGFRNNEKN